MNTAVNATGDALSGFVLLDLDGASIALRYINEDGSTFFSEQWAKSS
jgi:hypothetical protein